MHSDCPPTHTPSALSLLTLQLNHFIRNISEELRRETTPVEASVTNTSANLEHMGGTDHYKSQ